MSLRREATPFNIPLLDEGQKTALKEIISNLVIALENISEIVSKKANTNSQSYVGTLQLDRFNNLLFLHGKRGMGKTSVMLSLIRLIQDNAMVDIDKSDHLALITTGLSEDFKKFCNRIICLPPLDMDILPSSSNLLAAILVRLEELPKPYDELRVREIPWTEQGYLDGDTPVRDLNRLLRDTSIAMNGNLDARKNGLDPDVFADEQLRTERIRLDFAERLNETLEMIVSKYPAGRHPLFLMPIDDFDLNPPRCLELLERLHAIRSPYIMFLILGDVDIAETILGLQFANKFAEAVGSGKIYAPASDDEVKGIARELTAQARRKLIPPAQVIRLEPMTIDEALVFKPQDGTPTLGDLLNQIPLNFSKTMFYPDNIFDRMKIHTLKDFLLITSDKTTEKSESKYAYHAASILCSAPRTIYDLYQRLSAIIQTQVYDKSLSSGTTALIELVFSLCKESVNEASLNYEERKLFLDSLVRAYDNKASLDTENIESFAQRQGDIGDTDSESRLHMRRIAGWGVYANTNNGKTRVTLTGQAAAWVTLYHDLLSISDEHSIINSALTNGIVNGFVSRSFGILVNDHSLPLPGPTFRTFWECDQFRVIWNNMFDDMASDEKDSDKLTDSRIIDSWITCFVSTLIGIPTHFHSVTRFEQMDEHITNVVKHLWDFCCTINGQIHKSYALTNFALLLTCFLPELGAPSSSINAINELLLEICSNLEYNDNIRFTLMRIDAFRSSLQDKMSENKVVNRDKNVKYPSAHVRSALKYAMTQNRH